MWTYQDTDQLYHYGILGMKWGKHRVQSSPPSTAQKSKHRTNLEAKYRESGMSKKQAEAAADKRIKTEKILAVTAGITVAAATAYVVNKHIQDRTDHIVKSGTKLQVIAKNADKDLDRAFYTAYKESDKTKYKGLYGRQLGGTMGETVHKISLNVDKDLKVASKQKATDAFVDLYKHDEEFRTAFQESNKVMNRGVGKAASIHRIASKPMSDKQLRKAGYDAFNIGLVNHDKSGNLASKKFYDKLKDAGYNAVMDVNDRKYSGYKSKAPVIIFDKANKISLDSVKEMTEKQIASNANKAYRQLAAPEVAKLGAAYAGIIAVSEFGQKRADEAAKSISKKGGKRK